MIKAVIDTNVIVSAYITKNLEAAKPEHLIQWALDKIVSNGVRGERILSDESFPDPKDVVFYEVALSKEDAYLVTGNIKHFPKKPIVVTPAEMLEILQREGIM